MCIVDISTLIQLAKLLKIKSFFKYGFKIKKTSKLGIKNSLLGGYYLTQVIYF